MPNTRDTLRNLTPLTSSSFYDGASTTFHEGGLFSTEIFGKVSEKRRSHTFAYIDLNTTIIHPILYKNIEKVAGFYMGIMAGTSYATWDNKINQFIPSNELDGETGYSFFMRHFKDIEFTRNDSMRRNSRIDVLDKYRDTGVYDYLLVIPAGLRDAEEGKAGNLTMDEINDFYRSIISLATNIDKRDKDNPFNDSTKLLIQRNFNAIFELLFTYLKGKGGGIQGKFFKRKLENGTRGVLTAAEHDMEDMRGPQRLDVNDVMLGLHQTLKGTVPLVVNALLNSQLLINAFSSEGEVQVINPKTLKVESRTVSPKEKELFTTTEGVNTLINRFEKRAFRNRPVTLAKGFLAMVYIDTTNKTFKLVTDPLGAPKEYQDKLRPITYAEFLYYLIAPVVQGLPTWVTRYPIAGDGSTTPNSLYLKTTDKGLALKELDDNWKLISIDTDRYVYKEWPVIGGSYFETLAVHPNKLAGAQADFDGTEPIRDKLTSVFTQ